MDNKFSHIVKSSAIAIVASFTLVALATPMTAGAYTPLLDSWRQNKSSNEERRESRLQLIRDRIENTRQRIHPNPGRDNGRPDIKKPTPPSQKDDKTFDCQPQAALETTTKKIIDKSQHHIETLDKVHQRLQSFYANAQFVDPDFDDLNSAVMVAKIDADNELTSIIKLADDTTDCDKSAISTRIHKLRQGADSVKTTLMTYRSSLMLLVQSLRAEINPDNQPSTTPATDNSSTEN